MKQFHVTEIDQWLSCRRQHWFSYTRSLVPSKETKGPLWFGRGFHFALATWYGRGEDPHQAYEDWLSRKISSEEYADLWDDEKKEVDDQRELAHGMISSYLEFARRQDGWQVLSVETPIEVPVPGTDASIVGTLDLVVRRGGRLWVVDHKTVAGFTSIQALEQDHQMCSYLWLLWQSTGEIPAGAVYNQIKRGKPQEPRLLKDGTLSRAKYQSITHQSYMEAITRHNLNPLNYTDILEDLSKQKDLFHQREYIQKSPYELEQFGSTLQAIVREMMAPSTVVYPHLTRTCPSYCQFFVPCRAMNEGGDFESLIERQFRVVEGRED